MGDDDLRARVAELLGEPAPAKYDGNGNYEGRVGGTEHRTVGGRAWCYQCSEWCYAESWACPCCEPKIEPDDLRAALSPTPPDTGPTWEQHEEARRAGRLTDPCGPSCPTPPDTADGGEAGQA